MTRWQRFKDWVQLLCCEWGPEDRRPTGPDTADGRYGLQVYFPNGEGPFTLKQLQEERALASTTISKLAVLCDNHAETIASLRSEIDGYRAARIAYASEFPPTADGDPDTGSIHANIRALKLELAAASSEASAAHQRVVQNAITYANDLADVSSQRDRAVEEVKHLDQTLKATGALFVPGLRLSKGDYVVQLEVPKLGLFTERYETENDVQDSIDMAVLRAITAAIPHNQKGED